MADANTKLPEFEDETCFSEYTEAQEQEAKKAAEDAAAELIEQLTKVYKLTNFDLQESAHIDIECQTTLYDFGYRVFWPKPEERDS